MSTMFEPESEADAGGIMESIRRLGSSLAGLLQTRAELFAVELQEEKLRAIRLLVWTAVAITLVVAGLLVAIGGLALFFWKMAGYWGLAGLATSVLGLAAIILWIIHRCITRGPAPFAGTVAEFRKDAECLRK
jgi:uncharacterized membrane protein YqjE